jgi:alkanesulfonate monooxygenase SsuD/methylene tetrahydromethanopterin reductase-like flavin-dependent oxidoreductase (luciferase family)
MFGPLSALATAAAVTTTLHVGTTTFANDFRHPAMLAKEAATLDLISDGRALNWVSALAGQNASMNCLVLPVARYRI